MRPLHQLNTTPHKTDWRLYCAGFIALFIFAMQSWLLYGSTARDDAFLSYWPAHTLATVGEILNYNGDRIEQSSTLLLTLWLAFTAKLLPFLQIPLLAWLSSLFAAACTLLVTVFLLRQQHATVFASLVLATVPGFLYWANSGMETTTATLLLTIVALTLQQPTQTTWARWMCALVTLLAVLVRPEMALVLLCFGILYLLLLQLSKLRTAVDTTTIKTFLCIVLITSAAIALFRYVYFGQGLPQPVFAKSAGLSIAAVFHGMFYLIDAGGSLLTQLLLVGSFLSLLVALFNKAHPKRRAIICYGSLIIAQVAFVISSGGDWMEGARFLIPVIPCTLLCIFAFLAPWRKVSYFIAALLFAVGSYDSFLFARTQSTGFAQWERGEWQQHYLAGKKPDERYSPAEYYTKDALRDIPQLTALTELIPLLRDSSLLHQQPLEIASIQMGFIPYHLSQTFPGQLHFLDLRALSTRQISDCALTQQFQHTNTGIKISYDDFFALLPELQSTCGIHKPDVIYDMGWKMRKDVLLNNGYSFVYLEPRLVQGRFSQRGVGSDLFIAVRNELVTAAHLQTVQSNESLRRISVLKPITTPNIVLLLADDISYDTYGFMGNTAAKTPTIDQLAKEGTVFTTVHTPSSFCRPTLVSLLTGQLPHQSRIHANAGVVALPPGYPTVAMQLQQKGYATFAGGKFWEDEPELRGFDSFDVDKNTFARKNQDQLWQFIEHNGGKKPLFIWWAPMLPHTPHDPPQAFLDQIDPNTIEMPPELTTEQQPGYRERQHQFLAMTLWMDDEIRKLHDKLKEQNLLDNTLFVYMADNGFSYRAESKSTPSELGLRTPVIFDWPSHVPVQHIDNPTSAIHLYATLLDFAGIKAADNLPSKSLKPVIEHQKKPATEKLFGASYYAFALHTENDQTPRPERDIFALYVRDGDWKYVLYLRDVREEDNASLTIKSGMQPFPARKAGDEDLFYLPDDVIELDNLAHKANNSARLIEYRKAVFDWWQSTGGKPLDSLRNCPAVPAALCHKVTM